MEEKRIIDVKEEITLQEAKKLYRDMKDNKVVSNIDSFVSLKNVNKVYPNGAQAVFDFNLDIKKNEFVVLVGPSGCGKSTTLRMIGGLEDITKGDLYIDGVLSNYLPSKDRAIAMVFQNYALYPQMTVYENIAFGLKIKHLPKDEIKKRVFDAAKILGLGPYLDRFPKQLSGGQMQRVALGRAIVRDAKLFLFDEPLSNLDAKLRVTMRSEIVKIHEKIGATSIYVTHDQIEAMTMASKIVIMNKGWIQQIGTPEEIYNDPHNLFVATFIGTPPMNIVSAENVEKKIFINNNLYFDISIEENKKQELFYKNKYELFSEYKSIIDSPVSSNLKKYINEKTKDILNRTDVSNAISIIMNIKENANNLLSDNKNEVIEIIDSLIEIINNNQSKKSQIKRTINNLINSLNKEDSRLQETVKRIKSSQIFEQGEKEISLINKKKEKTKIDPHQEIIDIVNYYYEEYKKVNNEGKYPIKIGIRPEKITDHECENAFKIDTKIELLELLGSEYNIYSMLGEKNIIVKIDANKKYYSKDNITLYLPFENMYYFDSISGERI